MFFKDRYFGFDDAIYAACRLIEIVANSGQPLSAQTSALPSMVTTPEIRVDTHDEVKFDVVSQVRDHFRKTHTVVDVDGARVLFSEGWGLVRASNTQPVLVMRFEARTSELLTEYRREVQAVVDRVMQRVAAGRSA
jgi:phosphomannomutase / phosphoglucomutase